MSEYNDEVGGRLAEAMMLLEMALDGGVAFPVPDLVAAAHSLIQAARSSYTGGNTPVSTHAAGLLACISAAVAIADAQERQP